MMSPVAMFLLDGLIAVLLIATIWYCSVLNRRLNTIRDSNAELHQLVRQLNLASQNAERSATALKSAGEEAIRDLQDKIAQANGLVRDLSKDTSHAQKIVEYE